MKAEGPQPVISLVNDHELNSMSKMSVLLRLTAAPSMISVSLRLFAPTFFNDWAFNTFGCGNPAVPCPLVQTHKASGRDSPLGQGLRLPTH